MHCKACDTKTWFPVQTVSLFDAGDGSKLTRDVHVLSCPFAMTRFGVKCDKVHYAMIIVGVSRSQQPASQHTNKDFVVVVVVVVS